MRRVALGLSVVALLVSLVGAERPTAPPQPPPQTPPKEASSPPPVLQVTVPDLVSRRSGETWKGDTYKCEFTLADNPSPTTSMSWRLLKKREAGGWVYLLLNLDLFEMDSSGRPVWGWHIIFAASDGSGNNVVSHSWDGESKRGIFEGAVEGLSWKPAKCPWKIVWGP